MEYHIPLVKYNFFQAIFYPIFTIWYSRMPHKILIGSFSLTEIGVTFIAYRDGVTGLYSVGTSRNLHHNLDYNEVIGRINYLYDNNPIIRLKYIRMVQLLAYYEPANFGGTGNILSDHVLNSSEPIPTHLLIQKKIS